MKPSYAFWWAAASAIQLTAAVPKPQTAEVTSTTSIISLTSTLEYSTTSVEPSATPTNDACAQLASLARTSQGQNPVVPARVAWDCLQAVPYDAGTAEAWVESLRPYIEWQTTLAYLKDPPDDYPLPAYDLYAAYDQVLSKTRNGGYSNQHELEFAIYRVFQQAYDGHLLYIPNLVGGVVSFGRPFALVSLSSDGEELPKAYVYRDVVLSYNVSGFEPSAVTKINGQDATEFLESFSMYGAQQDPDALWNALFLELASIQLGAVGSGAGLFSGGGRSDLIYPNATTSLTFENGSTTTYENVARLLIPFSNIISAQDLYQRHVNPSQLPSATTASNQPTSTPAPGFPDPVLRSDNNYVGGYYIEGDDYKDIAVLSLAAFLGNGPLSNVFLDRAKTANKTKLIIDLSANGGGNIFEGFSLFIKLFPGIFPYLGTRYRATETFDIIGQTVSDYSNGSGELDYSGPNGYNPLSAFFNGLTPFPYASDVDADYNNFPDWPTKFGPHQYNGDNFTSIIRWNFSQPIPEVFVSNDTQTTTPLFEPENIILLTDGYCASTCSNFVEMMTSQAGVKTVTVGGRPNKDIVQAVGGTRGSNNYMWSLPFGFVNLTYGLIESTRSASFAASIYNNTEIGEYLGRSNSDPQLPLRRAGSSAGLNVRDNIRKDDEEQIPLQFVYQPTDCRLFWTSDMTVDITALWKDVADVSWGDGSCVAGSVQKPDSRKVKRGAKERMTARKLNRRSLSHVDAHAFAEGVSVWTDRSKVVAADGMISP